MWSVSSVDPSPSCEHLTFVKHVFYWGLYKLSNDFYIQCRSYQTLDQIETKLARKLLMLSDMKTADDPGKGFKIKKNSDAFQELWSIATAAYEWTVVGSTGCPRCPCA